MPGSRAGRNCDAPQPKATLFVTLASCQAHAFPPKRTPAKKLPKSDNGGTEVAAIKLLGATELHYRQRHLLTPTQP